jgi:hypothetical protein
VAGFAIVIATHVVGAIRVSSNLEQQRRLLRRACATAIFFTTATWRWAPAKLASAHAVLHALRNDCQQISAQPSVRNASRMSVRCRTDTQTSKLIAPGTRALRRPTTIGPQATAMLGAAHGQQSTMGRVRRPRQKVPSSGWIRRAPRDCFRAQPGNGWRLCVVSISSGAQPAFLETPPLQVQ